MIRHQIVLEKQDVSDEFLSEEKFLKSLKVNANREDAFPLVKNIYSGKGFWNNDRTVFWKTIIDEYNVVWAIHLDLDSLWKCFTENWRLSLIFKNGYNWRICRYDYFHKIHEKDYTCGTKGSVKEPGVSLHSDVGKSTTEYFWNGGTMRTSLIS